MYLKTNEPITIEITSFLQMCCIRVDGIDYAYIENAETVNLETVRNWVEETYYTGDYKCSAYIPCYLNASDFK